MLFNSLAYIIFLPIVFILYWFVFNRRLSTQNVLILVASYFFYGWWSWKFLIILATSTLIDYLYGFGVASNNRKKAKFFLWLGIINNLAVLGTFKYYNFFAVEFRDAFHLVGIKFNPVFLQVALPIGISFYTFHGISYIFDIYKGTIKPSASFIDYGVFVSFFPLLVAGPIERANHLLPQIQKKRSFNYLQAITGCRLILWGMFKKVVIADSLAVNVDPIFDNYQSNNALSLILAAIGFSYQIYCDFSGYSDIATGTAKLFGFELFSNFRFPYFSRNIVEFWRRWHISLSSWFKDYVYIPLGGSRKGTLMSVRNIFIIFILSGLWHGASWNFIVWGGIHACGLLLLLLLNKNRKYVTAVVAPDRYFPNYKELAKILSTFIFVTIAWIFFRMADINDAFGYITKIVKSSIDDPYQYGAIPPAGTNIALYILPVVFIDWTNRRNERSVVVPSNVYLRRFIYVVVLYLIFTLFTKSSDTMIYFQF